MSLTLSILLDVGCRCAHASEPGHLRYILVPATAEAQENIPIVPSIRLLHEPGDGVRRLERRNDSLQSAQVLLFHLRTN